MPPAVVAAGIGAVGAIGGGLLASSGAKSAANAQVKSDAAAIGEQRREFDLTQQMFKPYQQAGTAALPGIEDLLGLNGPDKGLAAINALKAGPEYQSLYGNGLETLMQNAAATGGLRGGNTQLALANFGRDTLSQVLSSQLSRLGGLAGLGENATGSVAGFGQNTADNISGLMMAQGNAAAQSSLTQAGIWANVLGKLGQLGTSAAFPHGF